MFAKPHPDGAWTYGYGLLRKSGLRSGPLYPILVRLADQDLLEALWEDAAPRGRSHRHQYRLTTAGRVLVRERVAVVRTVSRQLRPREA